MRGNNGGRALLHGRRVDLPPNTWRASVWARWGADLGRFRAESDLGPKMKFVHLGLLYIFC